MAAEDAGLAGGAQQVGAACKAELDAYNVQQGRNINYNVLLGAPLTLCRHSIWMPTTHSAAAGFSRSHTVT